LGSATHRSTAAGKLRCPYFNNPDGEIGKSISSPGKNATSDTHHPAVVEEARIARDKGAIADTHCPTGVEEAKTNISRGEGAASDTHRPTGGVVVKAKTTISHAQARPK